MGLAHEAALLRASKVFDYYYTHAIQEFDHITSLQLAQIPADYVYNTLISQEQCYINHECCLEYCNEILDHEFEKLDPVIKRQVYEKAFNVKTGFVSENEINTQLKKRRNNVFKNLYHNRFHELKENKENAFIGMFKNISINEPTALENIFKTLNLN
jgi:serine phosphatase RsbU (regulator of sigma subunit)